MPPMAALEYVRSIRPRVLLAPSQLKAVQEYSSRQQTTAVNSASGDVVLITKADLEGYHATCDNHGASKELFFFPRIKVRPPMMGRLSCLFACLKVCGVGGPVIGRLPEARAF
uniref:Uncharacterized protein MANES_16G106900 n=1 Tax=Rhizophora mucronata TaxID=61149 RepID=A0A2P2JPV5_RHIMU